MSACAVHHRTPLPLLTRYEGSLVHMCGRYQLLRPAGLAERFWIQQHLLPLAQSLADNANVSPGQHVPVVLTDHELALAQWGLVPAWAHAPKSSYTTINARAETVADKPTFRRACRFGRCLVPATGFSEWQRTERGKVPRLFRVREAVW
jgi:putative SOS response-associated peptidase YedK